MKKMILIPSIALLIPLILWFVWYFTPSGNNAPMARGFEPVTAEQYKTIKGAQILPKNIWNPKVILTCKAALVSAGAVVKKPDLKLQTVLETADKKSTLYFFGIRRVSGPTFVFRVDNESQQVLEKFTLPDA